MLAIFTIGSVVYPPDTSPILIRDILSRPQSINIYIAINLLAFANFAEAYLDLA